MALVASSQPNKTIKLFSLKLYKIMIMIINVTQAQVPCVALIVISNVQRRRAGR